VDSSNNLSYTAAAAASTPDAKQLHFPPPATPKSNVKKRLDWNPKQQLPNEQDSGNSAAMFKCNLCSLLVGHVFFTNDNKSGHCGTSLLISPKF
jgi:hypothetical protein